MSITINNNYVSSQTNLLDKLNNMYKKNVDEKVPIIKNCTNQEKGRNHDVIGTDIRQYLTVDEKKVLKEVFADNHLDKNTNTLYNKSEYTEFLKGTQLDVRL